jgi:antitoxin (DNA-binding transcriptional repressor) of toxin-antitoxin stability system
MKRLNVSEFREKCLSLLDQLPAEGVVITKRGQAIARVLPMRKDHADLIGKLAGILEIRGDVMSTGEKWDAES